MRISPSVLSWETSWNTAGSSISTVMEENSSLWKRRLDCPVNLDKRVEIVFPVEDPRLKEEVKHILHIQLADNVKAHILQPDGTYEKIDKRGKQLVNSQEYFCEEAHRIGRNKKKSGT